MPETNVTMSIIVPAALAYRLDLAVAAERQNSVRGYISRSSITRLAISEHLEKVLPPSGATVAR